MSRFPFPSFSQAALLCRALLVPFLSLPSLPLSRHTDVGRRGGGGDEKVGKRTRKKRGKKKETKKKHQL